MLFALLGFVFIWAPAVWTWLEPNALGAAPLEGEGSVADTLSRRLQKLAPSFYTTAAPDGDAYTTSTTLNVDCDSNVFGFILALTDVDTNSASYESTLIAAIAAALGTSESCVTLGDAASTFGRRLTSSSVSQPGTVGVAPGTTSAQATNALNSPTFSSSFCGSMGGPSCTVTAVAATTTTTTTFEMPWGRYTTTYENAPAWQTRYTQYPYYTTSQQPGGYEATTNDYAWTTRAMNYMWSSTWTWGGRTGGPPHGHYNGYATTTRPWNRNYNTIMTTAPMPWWMATMTTTATPMFDDDYDGEEDDMKQLLQFLAVASFLLPIIGIFFFICVYMVSSVIHLVSAIIYFQRVTSQRDAYVPPEGSSLQQQGEPAAPLRKHFRAPFCSCMDDMSYCLHGCFCMIPRQADSAAAAGVWDYWHLVLVAIGLHMVGPIAGLLIPFGDLLTWAGMAYIFGSLRAKLRARVGGDPGMTLGDFCTWCCCPCCAAIQEAKEIDIETRTRVDVCCHLVKDADGSVPLVGNAVEARTVALVAPPMSATAPAPEEA